MAQTGTVIPQGLNLRATPGGTVLTVLTQGTIVEILEDQGDFLKVSANGQVGFVAEHLIQRSGSGGGTSSGGTFHFVGNKAVAPDGTIFGKKFQQGIFNLGDTSIADFVRANPAAFPNLSPSRLRVMSAVSANEGKLEAINTFDNSFLTFGCFQWTVGSGPGAGELPAMVNQLKRNNAAVFNQLLGQFGLDVASVSSPPGQTPTGFFSLNGVLLNTAARKQSKLRTLEMAFRFFRAGQNDTMRQAEVEYAASRIDLFYRDSRHKIRNLFIADFVSSEFGVALILDQHVNRPANVPDTLKGAVNQFINSTGKSDPTTWTDQDEASLLNIYIERRNTTGMTDSKLRANRVRQAVSAGLASDKRGSFQP
ncbi:MAG TPA: SH3 domain-containing protein [Pyrinomonadaceae bacterium]